MDGRKVIAYWKTKKGKKVQPGVMSVAMSVNIARKKQLEIPFGISDIVNADQVSEATALLDAHNGKPVLLTPFQNRVIAALSYAVTQTRGVDEDIITKERSLANWRDSGAVEREIPINELAKFIFQRKVKPDDRGKVRQALLDISQIRQVQVFTTENADGEKKDHLVLSPLFTPCEEVISSDEDVVNIRFGRAFFHQVSSRYIKLPIDLFKIAATKGSGFETDVAWQLWHTLAGEFWIKRTNYLNVVKKIKKRAKDEGKPLTDTELCKAIEEARKAALYFRIMGSTIADKVTTDYTTQRKSKRLIEDINKASEAIKRIGLITSYRQTKSSGFECWDYWFNPQYNEGCETPEIE